MGQRVLARKRMGSPCAYGLAPGVNGYGDLIDINFDAVGAGMSTLTLVNEIFLDSTLTDITA